jgi:hypothetical protein
LPSNLLQVMEREREMGIQKVMEREVGEQY